LNYGHSHNIKKLNLQLKTALNKLKIVDHS